MPHMDGSNDARNCIVATSSLQRTRAEEEDTDEVKSSVIVSYEAACSSGRSDLRSVSSAVVSHEVVTCARSEHQILLYTLDSFSHPRASVRSVDGHGLGLSTTHQAAIHTDRHLASRLTSAHLRSPLYVQADSRLIWLRQAGLVGRQSTSQVGQAYVLGCIVALADPGGECQVCFGLCILENIHTHCRGVSHHEEIEVFGEWQIQGES